MSLITLGVSDYEKANAFYAALGWKPVLEIEETREVMDEAAPLRTKTLAAISDVTLEWLEAERERLRTGGPFDEDAARRFLG